MIRLLLILILCCTYFACTTDSLESRIERYIDVIDAEVGVAVVLDGNDTIKVNNETEYPLMSVLKFHQALFVADYMKRNSIMFDSLIQVCDSDIHLNTYSPMRDLYGTDGFHIRIDSLLKYSLQQSDNIACDVLFSRFGSPAEVDSFIRSLGMVDFNIAYTENEMHQNMALGYGNWSTPLSAANLMEWFVTEGITVNPYNMYLFNSMIECETGLNRLPKPLKGEPVRIGHKTGTGTVNDNGDITAVNDAGFVLLQDGRHYSIAVLVKDYNGKMDEAERIIADISEIVYEYVIGK